MGIHYYINGAKVLSYQIAFHQLQRAIWYGESAFETIRIQEDLSDNFLPFHIERLLKAAQLLSIQIERSEIEQSFSKVLSFHPTGSIRALLFREAGGKYKPVHSKGNLLFEVNTTPVIIPDKIEWNIKDVFVKQTSPLSQIKSNCYPYIQAGIHRISQTSLLINPLNEVLEWEIGAFIWKEGEEWFTIPKQSGQVESVFVAAVHAGKVPIIQTLREQKFNRNNISRKSKLYLGNAMLGLVPIHKI